jgi:hypothetical protein
MLVREVSASSEYVFWVATRLFGLIVLVVRLVLCAAA